ncbi:TetR/AcrR family transcriptional regulator [Actinophytocola oryzae]|uniref:TetR family transcriptional regulator n=1 Tax=Actinophytocola oryzae TaxID=502181 RepID=A0A4R7V7H4_9PSEU|nr:TetR/AcrR family transcriptional regulator [Actinophytocola oryzae]TDV44817.1 TetR family transcriptional regulator [Actinophytocola oryzae]
MAARARSDVREEAILLAAMALLAEIGYDRMSVEAVAERAKAGKATVYRRWSGKAELVTAAVSRYATGTVTPVERTGDLRADLLTLLDRLRRSLRDQDADLVLGLLGAMRHDAELARTVRQAVLAHKHDAFAALLPDADHAWLAELTSAALLSRLLVTGEPLDDEFLAKLVDTVLLPQL